MYIVSGWYKLATWGAIFASTLKLRPSNGWKDKSLWLISCFGTKQIWINKNFTHHLWSKALYVSGEKHRNRYNWSHDVLSTLTWKILPFPGFQIREFGHIILLWFSPNSSLIRQTLGMMGLLLWAGFIWSCDMFSNTQIFQVQSPKNFIFSLKMDTTKMLSQKYYQHDKKGKEYIYN